MLKILFQIYESLGFAVKALRENLLRTTLSLLGVSIGIFAIIGVFSLVDSLEKSVKNSLAFLGEDVIYVQKWPWIFAPNYPWWRYVNRPQPSIEEFKFLKENLTHASAVSVFAVRGNITAKHKSNSLSGIAVQGVTYEHNKVSSVEVETGRYFSPREMDQGVQVVIIGLNVKKDLFGEYEAVGKDIKIKGRRFRVIGVLEKQGENLLDAPSNDNLCIIPYFALTKMYATGQRGVAPTISVKGYENDRGLINIEYEIRGLLRRFRGQRPKEDDSFALNRPELFAQFLDNIFSVLTLAGALIGSFSILVGGFGIANIMFVSVKERTNLIGIQKSLGAKSYFILSQFLFEAVFLSLIGGLLGLGLVSLLTLISTETFSVVLGIENILIGLGLSSAIGIFSGIIPAIRASRMDPVEAIRTN